MDDVRNSHVAEEEVSVPSVELAAMLDLEFDRDKLMQCF
jgi:hypothetical protein